MKKFIFKDIAVNLTI